MKLNFEKLTTATLVLFAMTIFSLFILANGIGSGKDSGLVMQIFLLALSSSLFFRFFKKNLLDWFVGLVLGIGCFGIYFFKLMRIEKIKNFDKYIDQILMTTIIFTLGLIYFYIVPTQNNASKND